MAKALFGYWVIMWIKYTVMRMRIDHMLAFNWKFLTPLAFTVLLLTALVNAVLRDSTQSVRVGGLFVSNVLLAALVVEILRGRTRRERARTEGTPKPSMAGS
jgi:NADH-quinone oxidoreductase subunit H